MALPKPAAGRDDADRGPTVEPDLAEAVRRVRSGDRVLIHDGAAPVAAVISLRDLRRLEEDDRRRAEAIGALRAVGKAFAHLDPDEVEREAVLAVREARAEIYAERFGTEG